MAHELTKSLLTTTICQATTILHKWLVNFRLGTRRNNFTALEMIEATKAQFCTVYYFMVRPAPSGGVCSFNHFTIASPQNDVLVARELLCATIWRNKESLDLWLLEIILLIVLLGGWHYHQETPLLDSNPPYCLNGGERKGGGVEAQQRATWIYQFCIKDCAFLSMAIELCRKCAIK